MVSHSLRIGGATALYRAGHDIEKIKRFGRWTSSAVHSYRWGSNERQLGLAERMVAQTGSIITGQKPSSAATGATKSNAKKVRFA